MFLSDLFLPILQGDCAARLQGTVPSGFHMRGVSVPYSSAKSLMVNKGNCLYLPTMRLISDPTPL